mgnify:FL=1
MTKARDLSRLISDVNFTIDSTNNRVGVGSTIPSSKLAVAGIISATSFVGDGSGLVGVANTATILSDSITVAGITTVDASGVNVTGVVTSTNVSVGASVTASNFFGAVKGNVTGNATGLSGTPDITVGTVNATTVSVAGTITYNDVTNVDSVGVVTARSGIRVGAGQSISAVSGTLKYYGDGSELSGVVSGIEVKSSGSSVGTSLTAINFSGATVSTGSAGITTVTIAAAGISTNAYSGGLVYLDLSKDEHKVTATGITTLTVFGGTEGDTHIIRVINSGISTVGFSTYFLFPSGSTPSLPIADGAFSQISFQVNRVGAAGTQLFATAAVNFS